MGRIEKIASAMPTRRHEKNGEPYDVFKSEVVSYLVGELLNDEVALQALFVMARPFIVQDANGTWHGKNY